MTPPDFPVSRALVVTAAMASAIALGCQAPPQPVARAVRSLVSQGQVRLQPETAMVVNLTRECRQAAATYALAQAATALDPRIDHFKLRVTGAALVDPYDVTIPASRFNDLGVCSLTTEVLDLPPGVYGVQMEVFDAQGKPLAVGKSPTPVTVTANGPLATLEVACDFSTGDLDVVVRCCTSPTPGSGSPSPLPTLLPSPLPTFIERVHGLQADDLGNVYLFGLPRAAATTQPAIGTWGRVARVSPTGAVGEMPAGVTGAIYEADFFKFGGVRYLTTVSDRESYFPSAIGNANLTNYWDIESGMGSHAWGFLGGGLDQQEFRPWVANHGFSTASRAFARGTRDPNNCAGYAIEWVGPGAYQLYLNRTYLTGGRNQTDERPMTMTWNTKTDRPVWACKRGIMTTGGPNAPATPNPNATPRVLVSADPAYGVTVVDAPTNGVLYATYRDTDRRVLYASLDAAAPTPSVAYTFAYGCPMRVERGGDGFVYVLLIEAPLPFSTTPAVDAYHYEFPGKKQIRVVKMAYNPVSHTLSPVRLVVNTFDATTPSY